MIYKLLMLFVVAGLVSCTAETKNENNDRQDSTTNNAVPEAKNEDQKNIIFFGNSLTAGYGVEPSEAFSGLIQKRVDSLDLNYNVINAGVSGETTASGLSRVDWVVKRQPVDIFVLELGGNDGLRGIDPEETEKNLKQIIDRVRSIHPEVKIILAGMMVPPNMGSDYANKFQKIYPAIAAEKEVELIPFLLEDVGGVSELNLPDGIHPTPEGHEIVAETVWKHLNPLMEQQS